MLSLAKPPPAGADLPQTLEQTRHRQTTICQRSQKDMSRSRHCQVSTQAQTARIHPHLIRSSSHYWGLPSHSGEDLTNYRVQSRKVWRLVKSIVGPSCAVEKLGMDELFVDVTSLIARHLLDTSRREASSSTSNHTVLFTCDNGSSFSYRPGAVVGHTAPSTSEHVQHWHAVATHLAAHIREAIHRDLGLTVSGGVAHNKLLSKLLAAVHKPAKQTCLAQASADDLQRFLDPLPVQKLPGFGYRTRLTIAEHLPLSSEAAEVQKNEVEDDAPVEERYKVADLRRRATEQKLCTWLDPKIGPRLWALLHGQDEAAVVMTPDYPAQITVEDSFGGLNDFADVMRNTEALTLHLIERLEVDTLLKRTVFSCSHADPICCGTS